jgi:hypothetical protein
MKYCRTSTHVTVCLVYIGLRKWIVVIVCDVTILLDVMHSDWD